MKHQVAIVIPIVTPTIDGDELTSFQQCLRVLGKRDLFFICGEELDTTFYEGITRQQPIPFNKKCFEKDCFSSVSAYNRLCFDPRLYQAFADYEYILIYQLDAYIFEDHLDDWCQRGYDYVGGPWLCHWSNEVNNIDHWEVGNGGFSLRRVSAFKKILTHRNLLLRPLKGYGRLCMENRVRIKRNPVLRLWYLFRAMTGYHNTLQYYISRNGQEDKTYSQCQYNDLFRVPSAHEALAFSFDMRPATCFTLNGKRLPMGCHMWYKYDNEIFWYPIIYKNKE